MTLTQVVETVVRGLASGAIYGLIGIGLSLMYRTTRVINVAQGDLAALGGYVGLFLVTSVGISYFPAMLLAGAAVGLAFLVFERLFLRPIYRLGATHPIVMTVGLSLIIQGAITYIWGPTPRRLPSGLGTGAVQLFGITVGVAQLWTLLITLVLAVVLTMFLRRTRVGLGLRGAAQDQQVAALLGVNIRLARQVSLGLSAFIAGVGGMLVAQTLALTPTMGLGLTLSGAVAAIIGGFGNVGGALVGGLALGVITGVASLLIPSTYSSVVAYAILAGVLLVAPRGFFGEEGEGLREA